MKNLYRIIQTHIGSLLISAVVVSTNSQADKPYSNFDRSDVNCCEIVNYAALPDKGYQPGGG